MGSPAPKLLMGIGNVLRGDDGVGVEVATRTARLPLPPDVEVCEAGTAGLELASILERRQKVVVVDAIDTGGPPGSIYRLMPEDVRPTAGAGLSVHDLHLLHALDETRLLGTAPKEVVILAVQVADVSTGIRLSAPVRAAVPRVIALAARELEVPLDEPRGTPARASGEPPEPDRASSATTEAMPCH
jgi:hydrogenase maturation protease